MKQKHSHFLIPGILLLGIVLRAPFTTLSTVLSDIASGLGVEVSSLGLLTSLPLLTFAIFSPFAATWFCSAYCQSPSSLCGNAFSRSWNCLYQRPSPKPNSGK